MKILIVTGCVYAKNCGRSSFTGLDYVVSEIATKLGETNDVTVYTITSYPSSSRLENVTIRSYSVKKIIRYINIKDFRKYLKILHKKDCLKIRIRCLRDFIVSKDIEDLCRTEKFDVMHINGAKFSSLAAANGAEKNNIPVIFTLHGLISFGAPDVSKVDQLSEKSIINLMKKNNAMFTIVSEGGKQTICESTGFDEQNLKVINNAIKFNVNAKSIDIYKKYNIDYNKKIILCVGSLSERKNQEQLIRAYILLPEEIKKNYIVFFAGKDDTKGKLFKLVRDNAMQDNIKFSGFVSKDELVSLYKQAAFNVMLSKSEGFGLSMIEASYFGIPTLTFSDLDAIKDIYSKNSMLLIHDRKDESVKEGLLDMINNTWNKDLISKSVDKFSENVYLSYYELFKYIVDNGLNRLQKDSVERELGLL